jgi:predicted Fe-Mo cluster-binding NifX family protein
MKKIVKGEKKMKIMISSTGTDKNSIVDEKFGRAEHYIVYDSTKDQYIDLVNTAQSGAHGAGPKAAQIAIDEKVDCILTGNLGPKAMRVIEHTDIKAYYLKEGTVMENVDFFLNDTLDEIKKPGPSNAGK